MSNAPFCKQRLPQASFACDYIAELALIETSRQQREALEQVKWKPKKDNPLKVVLLKMKTEQ